MYAVCPWTAHPRWHTNTTKKLWKIAVTGGLLWWDGEMVRSLMFLLRFGRFLWMKLLRHVKVLAVLKMLPSNPDDLSQEMWRLKCVGHVMHLFCEWLWILVKCLDSSRMVGLVNGTWGKILTCNVAREISWLFMLQTVPKYLTLLPCRGLCESQATLPFWAPRASSCRSLAELVGLVRRQRHRGWNERHRNRSNRSNLQRLCTCQGFAVPRSVRGWSLVDMSWLLEEVACRKHYSINVSSWCFFHLH